MNYLKGAEPLFLEGTNHGILLIHGGGGGTTWDLKEFAYYANKSNYTVWLPALSGYNTKPEDLEPVKFTDWIEDGLSGLERLNQSCEKISVVGHSLGGLISLLLASDRNSISSVVTWAAAYGVNNRLLSLLPYISKIPIISKLIPNQIPVNPSEALVKLGWIGYEWVPTLIGLEFIGIINQLKTRIKYITSPAFVIQGEEDDTVKSNSARTIYEQLRVKNKELWIIENATHTLMQESCKTELFERTLDFIHSN